MSTFHKDLIGSELHVPHFESFDDPVSEFGAIGVGPGKVWRQHEAGDFNVTVGLFVRNENNNGWIPLTLASTQVYARISLGI